MASRLAKGGGGPCSACDNATIAGRLGHFECLWWRIARSGMDFSGVQEESSEDARGDTAMHSSAANGKTECLQWLVVNGGSPSCENEHGRVPAHGAAANGHLECLRLCAVEDACVAVDKNGDTPLHLAAVNGHTECVGLLLERSPADLVDAPNTRGWTPLHSAASRGHMATVRRLIDGRATVTLRALDGSSPADIASRGGHREVATLIMAQGPASVRVYSNRVASFAESSLPFIYVALGLFFAAAACAGHFSPELFEIFFPGTSILSHAFRGLLTIYVSLVAIFSVMLATEQRRPATFASLLIMLSVFFLAWTVSTVAYREVSDSLRVVALVSGSAAAWLSLARGSVSHKSVKRE
eukprot:Opistho-2@34441